jgi:uncharacterized paraquat-inducible protein A
MSGLVWLLMLYSVSVTLLTVTEGIPVSLGMVYNMLCHMALASHAKTSLSDPGSVPIQAIPSERQHLMKDSHSMCGQCQTFKPPMSHHCRICNRRPRLIGDVPDIVRVAVGHALGNRNTYSLASREMRCLSR